MVYYASSGNAPSAVAQGPVTYRNPYYNAGCGCGSGSGTPQREGFRAGRFERLEDVAAPAPAMAPVQAMAPPMCSLVASAPPAGCCNPAPLHCDCCNGSGFFKASEAYGS